MARRAVLLCATLVLPSVVARAEDPCFPRPILPKHVPAFAPGVPGIEAAPPSRTAAPGDELEVQRDCLRREASFRPRAEFAPLALSEAASPPDPASPPVPPVPAPTLLLAPGPGGGAPARFRLDGAFPPLR